MFIFVLLINANVKKVIMNTQISNEANQAINNLLFERAYEIENKLSEDNFFLAKMAGLKPEQVGDVALECAIKELKKIFSN